MHKRIIQGWASCWYEVRKLVSTYISRQQHYLGLHSIWTASFFQYREFLKWDNLNAERNADMHKMVHQHSDLRSKRAALKSQLVAGLFPKNLKLGLLISKEIWRKISSQKRWNCKTLYLPTFHTFTYLFEVTNLFKKELWRRRGFRGSQHSYTYWLGLTRLAPP